MGRKTAIDMLPPEVKACAQELIAQTHLTIVEVIERLRQRFPDEHAAGNLPGKDSIARERRHREAIRDKAIEQQELSNYLVAAAGDEDAEGKLVGVLLSSITKLACRAVMAVQDQDHVDVDHLIKLARAAHYITSARAAERKEREREESRRELMQEQRERLGLLGQSGEIDAETLGKVIRAAYDL